MYELITPASSRIQCGFGVQSAFTDASLAAFGVAFGVEFILGAGPGSLPSIPLVLIGEATEGLLKHGGSRRAFLAPAEATSRGEEIDRIEICGEVPGKPWLRHQTLKLPKAMRVEPLQLRSGAEVLGRSKAGPVWVREVVGGAFVDRVALPLPVLAPDRPVFEWFNSNTFPQLLPLLQFVREVTGEHRWNATRKACFMFDDPNLHAQSYGFIRYRELASRARESRYHVSFATVPLDAWFVSSRAAALFRENKAQLSLLIHGNDHLSNELARDFTENERLALLGQALRRVRQLEVRSGVEVCRVMAAPHGACRENMMRDMARSGFEAACISHGSLEYHNRKCSWSRTVGNQPAEIIAGLPIIPRFPISADILQKVLFAAYLDQPIVPMGHHQDVAGGLDVLDRLAEQINSLGGVQWTCMSEIAKTHFQWRMDAETLVVRPCSRLARISVPGGAARIRVELPPHSGFDPIQYTLVGESGARRDLDATGSATVSVGETVYLKPASQEDADLSGTPLPRLKCWPILRRVASEVRDRARPWLLRS